MWIISPVLIRWGGVYTFGTLVKICYVVLLKSLDRIWSNVGQNMNMLCTWTYTGNSARIFFSRVLNKDFGANCSSRVMKMTRYFCFNILPILHFLTILQMTWVMWARGITICIIAIHLCVSIIIHRGVCELAHFFYFHL